MAEDKNTPSFEETLAKLDSIVNEMESGDLPLQDALEKFEQGIKLSRLSQKALEEAEQKVQILLSEQQQETLSSFDPEDADSDGSTS
ncbi:exodeoxyribonuclease VII small subunit [Alteromonas ponticola]|uniref:Exodeoxyribonuclease 7 small subunit n=1 Tax=Alteromonas aquimaris TaxID=2998417 RepID=A0ABT3P3T0_9ALTE|nr:exodeoxyribonuclease VII small subunit [Alteromonas aquimaris]MCW8107413.1 exodeoxyribonuclease VII small subunit [Alteromonas aquimaris]